MTEEKLEMTSDGFKRERERYSWPVAYPYLMKRSRSRADHMQWLSGMVERISGCSTVYI